VPGTQASGVAVEAALLTKINLKSGRWPGLVRRAFAGTAAPVCLSAYKAKARGIAVDLITNR
jgi:hypothetical protein